MTKTHQHYIYRPFSIILYCVVHRTAYHYIRGNSKLCIFHRVQRQLSPLTQSTSTMHSKQVNHSCSTCRFNRNTKFHSHHRPTPGDSLRFPFPRLYHKSSLNGGRNAVFRQIDPPRDFDTGIEVARRAYRTKDSIVVRNNREKIWKNRSIRTLR